MNDKDGKADKIGTCADCYHSFVRPNVDKLFCGAFFGNSGVSAICVECKSVLRIHKDGCPKVKQRRSDQPQIIGVE
jgi:hypothetical protein